ncbi:peptidoglycan-binding protein [Streptomyces jumonjinensis]|uniref:peptidoglycan-binding protein n=1 Tax=Streptomyces jumonjinensis TaxID=1945 RepID=UPI0037ADA47D
MKRTRTLWTAAATALSIAVLTALGATQAPDSATAHSGDPAAEGAVRAADSARAAAPAVPAPRAAQPTVPDRGQTRPTVRNGSRGTAVTTLQNLLTAQGHTVTPDGIFGPRTEAAVIAFQTRHRLQADGIVGPNTWNALHSTGARPETARNAGPLYSLKFTKNWQYPTWSTLSLLHDGKVVKSYRAGSGEKGITDECASNKGWLPSGTYPVLGHETDRNSGYTKMGIKGYAIQLADKYCAPKPGQQPVKRTSLFIHSEMLSNGTQAPDVPGMADDYYLWNGDGDYESYGCIKLTPTDIKDLFSRLGQAGWPKNLTLQVR